MKENLELQFKRALIMEKERTREFSTKNAKFLKFMQTVTICTKVDLTSNTDRSSSVKRRRDSFGSRSVSRIEDGSNTSRRMRS